MNLQLLIESVQLVIFVTDIVYVLGGALCPPPLPLLGLRHTNLNTAVKLCPNEYFERVDWQSRVYRRTSERQCYDWILDPGILPFFVHMDSLTIGNRANVALKTYQFAIVKCKE